MSENIIDPRINAFTSELADIRLKEKVSAARYVTGQPATISCGMAMVKKLPDLESSTETYFHYGEGVVVFNQGELFCWCQSIKDGYVGYVLNENVSYTASEGDEYYIKNMGTYIYHLPDLRTKIKDFLPRDAKVFVTTEKVETRGMIYRSLVFGGFVLENTLSLHKSYAKDIVSIAERYLGCPYLWGGRSFFGIDCSGLVQACCDEIGVLALRDASLQIITLGKRIYPASTKELISGDLVYTPHHVGIIDQDKNVIHADGITMMVIRQPMEEFLQTRELCFEKLVFKRL